MEVLYPHCAGLDVHKDTVVACVRHMVNGSVRREVRSFKTTTKELLALSDWLAGAERSSAEGGLIRPTAIPSGSSTTAYLEPQKAS